MARGRRTGYVVTCVTVEPVGYASFLRFNVTVEPVGYASFLRVNVTVRNREPALVRFCVTERNREPTFLRHAPTTEPNLQLTWP